LDTPTGVFVNTTGSVYIADTNNHRIQRWAPGATKGITVAGGHGQGDADNQLNTPTGVFVNATGSVYIADKVNHRIQKYYYTPEITIAAGETTGSIQVTGLKDTSGGDYNNDDDGDEIIELTPITAKNATLPAVVTTTIAITISDDSSLHDDDVVMNDADIVLAYPNPSTGIFEIAVPISEKEVIISIYTIYGQLISKRTYPVVYGKVRLNIKNQPAQLYLVKVQLATTAVTLKIIKK